jgi:hypothetical protein
MNATLSSEDLRSRVPVWEALADFWLDTELADLEFDYIARVIAASPYSIDEVRAIHDYEVAPAVSGNLACVAGEWAGFDKEWLEEKCRTYAGLRQSRWHRARIWLQRPFFRRLTARYWQQIIPRVLALRGGAPETFPGAR